MLCDEVEDEDGGEVSAAPSAEVVTLAVADRASRFLASAWSIKHTKD